MLISVGAGQPPFWHGDAGDVNLATARVMQEPALRRLQRRQEHTRQMIIDLCYIAYGRSFEKRGGRQKPNRSSVTLQLADLTREDNRSLADAAARSAEACCCSSASTDTRFLRTVDFASAIDRLLARARDTRPS